MTPEFQAQLLAPPDWPGTTRPLESGQFREAMARAGHLLAARAHGEQELVAKLLRAGFEAAVVERAVSRLKEIGLVDDVEFARSWVQERARRAPAARDRLVGELVRRGVEREMAERAVDEAAPDENEAAVEAASRRLRRIAHRPLAHQAKDVYAWLLRRGFEAEVAEAATRAVLPPEGWD